MTIVKLIKNTLFVILMSVILFLAIDNIIGKKLLVNFVPSEIDSGFRISHPIYHHTLASNYQGNALWGGAIYKICTNNLGFKSACDKSSQHLDKVDIAFIGDSFTEGVGLPFEDTFVGQIANALPKVTIANLAVSSYSPSIYRAKIEELFKNGFSTKSLVIYLDISDIQDEAQSYLYKDGVVQDLPPYPKMSKKESLINFFDQKIRRYFPITFFIMHHWDKRVVNLTQYLDKDFERGAWTYNPNTKGYGQEGVSKAIEKTLSEMQEIYEITSKKGIELSIGVYPWPSQLLYDKEYSMQVQIWESFCKTRCAHFFNVFPKFFEIERKIGAKDTIAKYYIPHDIHFNVDGNRLIADNFLENAVENVKKFEK